MAPLQHRHLKSLLQHAVKQFGQKPALIGPSGEQIAYSELSKQVKNLSQTIANQGESIPLRIGIYLPKSIQKVVAIFATLESDAAYIPVDPQAPAKRNAYIFEDCQVQAILITNQLIESFASSFSATVQTIDLPDFPEMKLLLCSYQQALEEDFPEDLAYMLYTSGSTGHPKGVMISHENALSFVDWSVETFSFSPGEVFSSIAPFHFDLSIFDLYVSLSTGGCLVLIDQKGAKNPMLISSLIQEHKISVVYSTPSLLNLLMKYGKMDRYDHSSLKLLLFAGEVFHMDALRALKAQWAGVDFYNLYGPTETNVVTFFKIPEKIEAETKAPYPIGKSCSHVDCQLWDKNFLPLESGQKGELLVTGSSVMPAYFNLKEKNEQVFIRDEQGKKWYRTGDLIRINSDLDFVFVGRYDRMVKRRAYRIELGEIEQVLNSHKALTEAAVIATKNEKGETLIKVFAIKKPANEELKVLGLKQFCLSQLPMYMLPDKFIFLKELPKTSTHKIDYQKLSKLIDS